MFGCDMMGGGAMMGIWVLLFLAIVIGGVWLIGRAVGGDRDRGGEHTDPALRILEERYARGEIDEDEFVQRRRTLNGA
jgi:putative membrane protein